MAREWGGVRRELGGKQVLVWSINVKCLLSFAFTFGGGRLVRVAPPRPPGLHRGRGSGRAVALVGVGGRVL